MRRPFGTAAGLTFRRKATAHPRCQGHQDPPYPYPNQHDYDELDIIYGHLDSYDAYSTGSSSGGGGNGCNAPPGKGCNKRDIGAGNAETGWGISLGRHGQSESFLRIDPAGTRHLTTSSGRPGTDCPTLVIDSAREAGKIGVIPARKEQKK